MTAETTLFETTDELGDPPRHVHRLTVTDESEWRRLVERIQCAKSCLDRILNFRAEDEVTSEDRDWARQQRIDVEKAPIGTGITGFQFLRVVVGSFYEPSNNERVLTRVPSWSVIGWNRCRHKADDCAQAQCIREAKMDLGTVAGEGSAWWLSPLPLLEVHESHNRVEMHAKYFNEILVNLQVAPYPDPSTLRLRRVVGADCLLALTYTDPYGRSHTELLPFPELSIPVFERLGVNVRSWWLPWPSRATVRAIASSVADEARPRLRLRIALAFRPNRLRAELLKLVLHNKKYSATPRGF